MVPTVSVTGVPPAAMVDALRLAVRPAGTLPEPPGIMAARFAVPLKLFSAVIAMVLVPP